MYVLYVILLPCKENLGQFLNGLGLSEIKWAKNTETLKKLGINLPCDQAIPPLSIYPEKTTILKDTCTPVFIAALLTIARTWKQPRCPSTEEQIKKCGIYIQWNVSHKKKQTWNSCSEVGKPRACYTEWSKSEQKSKCCILTRIYGI